MTDYYQGMAISGGVDSMALASLCRQTAATDRPHPSFTGFIVDHRLREGSTEEACRVAEVLQQMRVEPHILTLDWTSHGDPSTLTNLESVARRLRYQALGTACRDHDIRPLLVAHHADDQAETVLLRLIGGYHGLGLRGIKSERPIPHCMGLYGINESGKPHTIKFSTAGNPRTHPHQILIEGGGVNIVRPLLPYSKDQLIRYCQDMGVRWFEDHTNKDPTFTLRNTVRHLLKGDRLPVALQRPRLLALATRVADHESHLQLEAQQLFEGMEISLDVRIGRANIVCRGASRDSAALAADTYSQRLILLRKLLALLSPSDDIPLPDLHDAVEFVWPDIDKLAMEELTWTRPNSCQSAGVKMSRSERASGLDSYILQRSLPYPHERASQEVEFFRPQHPGLRSGVSHRRSAWRLWDNRYWLRIYSPHPGGDQAGSEVIVRFLNRGDLAALRKSLNGRQRQRLDKLLEAAPGDLRFTLPAIVIRAQSTSSEETPSPAAEQTVALPSLGWSAEGWQRCPDKGSLERLPSDMWSWDIRYRHVDFAVSDKHTVVSRANRSSKAPRVEGNERAPGDRLAR